MSKKFISFITAGDPSMAKTKEFIEVLAEHSDIIEIGLPFSDPLAEGEIIEAANMRALANGATTTKMFEMLKSTNVDSKLVILTYINPIFVFGTEKFFANCKDSGIWGVIIPDLPFEEIAEVKDFADKYGVHIITLISPTSAERVKMLAKEASGFIYLVSSMGVTGVRENISIDSEIVAQLRSVTDVPVCIGFGISTPEQANTVREVADGVIIGSAFVKIIAEHGENAAEPLRAYLKSMV